MVTAVLQDVLFQGYISGSCLRGQLAGLIRFAAGLHRLHALVLQRDPLYR
jgi:hypothetical protein